MYMDNEDEMTLKRGPKMMSYVQFFVDIIILIIVVVTFVLVWTVLPVNKTGFFCNDPSIKYPIMEETISEVTLLLACVFIPLVIIFFLELIHKFRYIGFFGCFVSFLKYYGFAMLGLFGSLLITEVAKKTMGIKRPDFWKMCMPTYDMAMCDSGKYISMYMCTNNMTMADMDMITASHPSSTATMVCFIVVWLAVYFQYRLKNPFSMFIKIAMQCGIITIGFYVMTLRLYEYKSRWDGVVVGGGVGLVTAIWIILASDEHLDYDFKVFVIEDDDEPEMIAAGPRPSVNTRTTYYGNAVNSGASSTSNIQRVTVGDTGHAASNTNSAFVYDK